jgi:EpsI family protein
LLLAGLWPWLAQTIERENDPSRSTLLQLPQAADNWDFEDGPPPWQGVPNNAVDGQKAALYTRDGKSLGLVLQYRDRSDDGEVIGSSTRFASRKEGIWWEVDRDKVSVELNGVPVLVDQARLRGLSGEILVWSWYRVGDLYTSNDYRAKVQEALASFGFAQPGTFRVSLIAPLQESVDATQELLQQFLNAHESSIDQTFTHFVAQG